MSRLRLALALLALLALLAVAGCRGQVVTLSPTVIASYPHDPDAFTQGLLLADGRLYESTGLYGRSSLREVDLESGRVLRQRDLEATVFAEGLALVDDRLIQLSWKEGVAFVYDRETFDPLGRFDYGGEGWGLCYDGEALFMSDGSATLTVRDPHTFAVRRRLQVTQGSEAVTQLNELECVDGKVYANVWQTDRIVRIDAESGRVDAVIDASALLPAAERGALRSQGGVLNGIAYDPAGERFLLTGKLWPRLFVVTLP